MTYHTKHTGRCTTVTGPKVEPGDIAAMLTALRAQTPAEKAADVADMDARIEQAAKEVPFAYAWRWKGSDTWKLTLTKKPNHHPGIEIKELFARRATRGASHD